MDILETSFIYLASALLFSEVYIWSVPQGAELRWVVEGRYVCLTTMDTIHTAD